MEPKLIAGPEMRIGDYSLVLAIDSTKEKEVLGLSSDVGSLLDAVKVGVPTLFACGVGVVKSIKKRSEGPVVADLKVADIGFEEAPGSSRVPEWSGTNRKIIEEAVGAGIDYIICHTIVGTSSIRECIDTAHSMGAKVLTLPYMTGQGGGLFFDSPIDQRHVARWLEGEAPATLRKFRDLSRRKASEKGWRSRSLTTCDLILLLGEEFGVDGYIAPANHPEIMKDYRRISRRFALATGVGRQGGKIEDVYRILGPKSGAIVGHAICEAPDPVLAARQFLAERDEARGKANGS